MSHSAEAALLSRWYPVPGQLIAILDVRQSSCFAARRLTDSCNIPASQFPDKLFLLPDRDVPLGIVCPTAAVAVQLTDLLTSRGWSSLQGYLQDGAPLWEAAATAGVLEQGESSMLTAGRSWLFRPCHLLEQEVCRVELHLALARLKEQLTVQHTSAIVAAGIGAHCAKQDESTTGCGAPAIVPAVCPRVDVRVRALDIGCGSGRDLAWLAARRSFFSFCEQCFSSCHASTPGSQLISGASSAATNVCSSCGAVPDSGAADSAHTPHVASIGATQHTTGPHHPLLQRVRLIWDVTGIDSWPGALEKAQLLLQAGQLLPSQARLHGARIHTVSGELEPLHKDGRVKRAYQACLDQAAREGVSPHVVPLPSPWPPTGMVGYDLLLCVRFLQRSFLPVMTQLLNPQGGILLYSSFVDLPGVRAAGKPSGVQHVLNPSELSEQWAGPRQDMQVLRDNFLVLPDGRELSMYMAVHLPDQ